MSEPTYPAAFTMYWAGQPVNVCPRHGRALMNIARAMGGGLSFGGGMLPPEAPEGAECSNCVNEAAASQIKEPSND